jgi:hypothetical protein
MRECSLSLLSGWSSSFAAASKPTNCDSASSSSDDAVLAGDRFAGEASNNHPRSA